MSHILEPHSRATAAKLLNDLASNPELGQMPGNAPIPSGDHHLAQLESLRQTLKSLPVEAESAQPDDATTEIASIEEKP